MPHRFRPHTPRFTASSGKVYGQFLEMRMFLCSTNSKRQYSQATPSSRVSFLSLYYYYYYNFNKGSSPQPPAFSPVATLYRVILITIMQMSKIPRICLLVSCPRSRSRTLCHMLLLTFAFLACIPGPCRCLLCFGPCLHRFYYFNYTLPIIVLI